MPTLSTFSARAALVERVQPVGREPVVVVAHTHMEEVAENWADQDEALAGQFRLVGDVGSAVPGTYTSNATWQTGATVGGRAIELISR